MLQTCHRLPAAPAIPVTGWSMAPLLRPGDRLQVWQWQELRALGLTPAFDCRRRLERWLDLEEPWLLDPRWAYPLHLVEGAVLAALGVAAPNHPDEDHANP